VVALCDLFVIRTRAYTLMPLQATVGMMVDRVADRAGRARAAGAAGVVVDGWPRGPTQLQRSDQRPDEWPHTCRSRVHSGCPVLIFTG
jgi:hypothetical protein